MSAVLDTPAPPGPRPAETFGQTLARLGGAQKGALGAPAYSRFVNRRMGRFLAAVAYHAGLTPNAVTGISAAFSATGIAVLALVAPSWPMGVAVAACLVVGYELDSADGQLARLTGGGSLSGEWLDHTVDSIKVVAFHLVVLVALQRNFDLDLRWLLVPLAFAVASSVHFFGMILVDLFRRLRAAEPGGRPAVQPTPSRLTSLLKIPTDYGVLCLAMVLLGFHGPFLTVYTVLAAAMVGYTALVLGKWGRDIAHLERGGRP